MRSCPAVLPTMRVCVCVFECVSLAVLISVGVIDRVVESAEQSD